MPKYPSSALVHLVTLALLATADALRGASFAPGKSPLLNPFRQTRRRLPGAWEELQEPVVFGGGVCPSLPAGRVPVIHDPPAENEGWSLVDFCLEGSTGYDPADQDHCHYNDDDSSSQQLGFDFHLFGDVHSKAYLNNNGNISFEQYFSTYTATGFPAGNYKMVGTFRTLKFNALVRMQYLHHLH